MSFCPRNDAGHEPLHTANPESGVAEFSIHKITPKDPRESIYIIDGPAGTAHFCKHCRLLYFQPDDDGFTG